MCLQRDHRFCIWKMQYLPTSGHSAGDFSYAAFCCTYWLQPPENRLASWKGWKENIMCHLSMIWFSKFWTANKAAISLTTATANRSDLLSTGQLRYRTRQKSRLLNGWKELNETTRPLQAESAWTPTVLHGVITRLDQCCSLHLMDAQGQDNPGQMLPNRCQLMTMKGLHWCSAV
jgi:hypothetical protein